MREKEIRHEVVCFEGLRQFRLIPKRVGKGVEHDKACIDTCAQIGTMQIRRAA